MAEGDLSGRVSLDTTEFKTAIAQLNRDLRTIESCFRASAAELGDWGKSVDGLQMRIEALNRAIDAQGKKVEALTGEYNRIAQENGETSRVAQEMQIRLNKETEALGKMKAELNSTSSGLAKMDKDSKSLVGVFTQFDREVQIIESGFRAATAGMDDWSKSADGLKLRIKALNDEMAAQEEKLVAMSEEYNQLVKEQGKSSKESQEMLIRINKESEALGKMQRELNQSETALNEMGNVRHGERSAHTVNGRLD